MSDTKVRASWLTIDQQFALFSGIRENQDFSLRQIDIGDGKAFLGLYASAVGFE